jgi:hypothetical protein
MFYAQNVTSDIHNSRIQNRRLKKKDLLVTTHRYLLLTKAMVCLNLRNWSEHFV